MALEHKVSRRTREEQDKALSAGLRVALGDETYEVRFGDMTSTLTRELRAATGMSFQRLMWTLERDPDADVIASFVWLAKRVNGDAVDLDDVEVTYADLLDGFEVHVAGDDDEAETENIDPEG